MIVLKIKFQTFVCHKKVLQKWMTVLNPQILTHPASNTFISALYCVIFAQRLISQLKLIRIYFFNYVK